MDTSPEVDAIFAALIKAQAEFQAIKEDAKNEHLGYRYTTLARVLDATRAALASHGLGVIQGAKAVPEKTNVEVTTLIIHAGGQWIRSTLTMPYGPHRGLSPAQTMGVAITYARRYALMGMLGVSSAEDDTDAAQAQQEGHVQDKQGTAAREDERAAHDKAQLAAWLKQQLEGFKDNLQTTQTEGDVSDCVSNLLAVTGELPAGILARVHVLAAQRIALLKERPPSGFGKDAPNEEDSAAVNEPEHTAKPNGSTAEFDSPLAATIHQLRDPIRHAQNIAALDLAQAKVDALYKNVGDQIFADASARAAWDATTEFLAARRKLLEQRKA